MPKVLVVDDEPNIQKLLETSLVARGYHVLVVSNGEAEAHGIGAIGTLVKPFSTDEPVRQVELAIVK